MRYLTETLFCLDCGTRAFVRVRPAESKRVVEIKCECGEKTIPMDSADLPVWIPKEGE